MKTVSILGAGNVASHLARAFVKNTIQVNQIYNRTLHKAQKIGEANNIRYTHQISELEKSDIFVIASSDRAISELSLHIPFDDVIVVHTSGSMTMNALKGNYKKGVFYPLQTFTQDKYLDYNQIPLFLEGEDNQVIESLNSIAKRISNKVKVLNSEQRAQMHLAAVWACNFTNYMYSVSEQIVKNADLSFDYLKPLIRETANKIEHLSPYEAQTGAAKRNDQIIIEKHLNQLEDLELKELYAQISQSITKTYQNEL